MTDSQQVEGQRRCTHEKSMHLPRVKTAGRRRIGRCRMVRAWSIRLSGRGAASWRSLELTVAATTCRSRRAPNSLQTGHWSARHRSLEQPLAEFRWGFHCKQGRGPSWANLWLAGEVTYVAASSGVSPNVKPVSSRVAVGAEIARWNSAVSVARGRRNRVMDRPTRQARKPRGLARLIGDLGCVADQV
jgi:hypothetical protein